MHPDTQAVDEAFVMANYLQLDPLLRKRMRELRLQGVATCLNYSSEDVDEDRELEVPLRFRSQPPRGTKGQAMEGVPPLLAAHLRETKRRRRTLSPKEGESVQAFITRYTDETSQITRLNEDQRIVGFIHGVKIKSLVKFISTKLPESYDGLMEKVYSWLQAETASEGRPITFMDSNSGEKTPKRRPCEGSRKKNRERRDRELKRQIKEVVKSGKLAYLVKGIGKGKAKKEDNQLGEWAALTIKAKPTTDIKEEPILMIGAINNPLKRKEPSKIMSVEEMIFPPIRNRAPSVDPILISVQVFRRQVGRVLLDGGAACDIIYEHCFLKL
ncbi:hypothetical protein Tco_1083321 [Tanacetum coccineum]